jgi:hypothetical protein
MMHWLPLLAFFAQLTTSQWDNARTGANLHESILTPATVRSPYSASGLNCRELPDTSSASFFEFICFSQSSRLLRGKRCKKPPTTPSENRQPDAERCVLIAQPWPFAVDGTVRNRPIGIECRIVNGRDSRGLCIGNSTAAVKVRTLAARLQASVH